MPDSAAETLYTLTHPEFGGMVLSGSSPWEALLQGIEVMQMLLRRRMESGEVFPTVSPD